MWLALGPKWGRRQPSGRWGSELAHLGANLLEPWAGEGVPGCSASSPQEKGLLQYLHPGVIPHDKGKPGVP